jgi:hypothetical protein
VTGVPPVAATNVTPAGSVSEISMMAGVPGPLLVAVIVYVRLAPGLTGSGESVFTTEMSGPTDTAAVTLFWVTAKLKQSAARATNTAAPGDRLRCGLTITRAA